MDRRFPEKRANPPAIRRLIEIAAVGFWLFGIASAIAASWASTASGQIGPAVRSNPAPGTSLVRLEPPRLVVLISVDQLRGDYLERFGDHFGRGGFRRLMDEGAWFPRAFYGHGATATGPGHACISTGCNPRVNGISVNRGPDGEVSSDSAAPLVGLDDPRRTAEGGSARRLLVPTVGELLKQAQPASRSFSVGLKRRATILLAGRKADGVFWYDGKSGRFVSSTAYMERLPGYVAELNASRFTHRFATEMWDRALPAEAYSRCAPDDDPVELDLDGMGRTFPHRIPGSEQPGAKFYAAIQNSPFGNEIVLDLARRVVTAERLGGDTQCDLLCIALSANDVVGHAFGPESHEVLDMTVRTDRQLAELFEWLDQRIGRGAYTVALTADHGVAPVAGRSLRAGRDAGLVPEDALRDKLNRDLTAQLGTAAGGRKLVDAVEFPWIFLDVGAIRDAGLAEAGVINRCAALCRAHPGIARVFTAEQLAAPRVASADEELRLAWEAFCPGRAGQIYVALQPYWHETSNAANHGTYQEYDRHVPVMLWGAGVRSGRIAAAIQPIDIAPTLLRIMGLPPPASMQGRVLDEALLRT